MEMWESTTATTTITNSSMSYSNFSSESFLTSSKPTPTTILLSYSFRNLVLVGV